MPVLTDWTHRFGHEAARLETVPGGENDEHRQLESGTNTGDRKMRIEDLHFGAAGCKVLGRSDTYK